MTDRRAPDPQPDDEAFSRLLERARSGDPEAVEELHRRHAEAVAARVRARSSRALRRRYDVDDVAQSVFAEVLRDLERFEDRGEGAFRNWLYAKVEGKVRQKLSSLLRAEGGRREVTARSDVVGRPAHDGPGPATESGRRDEIAHLRGLLHLLTDEQREVVELRTRERLSFVAIAERLELPSPDAARMRFARAITTLRTAWDAD